MFVPQYKHAFFKILASILVVNHKAKKSEPVPHDYSTSFSHSASNVKLPQHFNLLGKTKDNLSLDLSSANNCKEPLPSEELQPSPGTIQVNVLYSST